MRVGRWIAPTALAALTLALAHGTASAVPAVPTGVTLDFGVFPAGEYCSFPVHIVARTSQSSRTPEVVTGPAVATVTNVASGRSRTYNISGPVIGNKDTGQTLLGQPIENSTHTFLIVVAGQPKFNPDGTLASLNGHVLHDICAELAG